MCKWFRVLVLLVLILGAVPVWDNTPPAEARGISIDIFTISPSSPVDRGTWLSLYGKASGNVRAVRFEANGQPKAEIGTLEQRETIKTEEFPAGNLELCFVVAENDWGSAIRSCQTYWVNDVTPPPSVTTGGANVDGYCKAAGYDRGRCPGDAYSCRCAYGNTEDEIDMYSLCAWQYGGSLPYPGLDNASDPNGWTCNASQAYVDGPIPQPSFYCGDSQCNGDESSYTCAIDCGAPVESSPAQNEGGGDTGGSNDDAGGWSDNSGGDPSSANTSCPRAVNLRVGGQGRVVPSTPNNLRSCGSTDCSSLGKIPVGGIFEVLDGPYCAEGYNWWQVQYNGRTGWTADGDWSADWLAPFSGSSSSSSSSSNGQNSGSTSSGSCPAHVAPVAVGGQGRVLPGDPNHLRYCAGLDGSGCQSFNSIPAGGIFYVIGGPTCADGYYWWQVRYNGQVGWTAEGTQSEYWIENVSDYRDSSTSGGEPSMQCFYGDHYEIKNDTTGEHNLVIFNVGNEYDGYPNWGIYPPSLIDTSRIINYQLDSPPQNGVAQVSFNWYGWVPKVYPASWWLICSR